MYKDGGIWVGSTADGKRVSVLPKMANRHGLIAGATGTGKTVTLKVLAESFSDMGVPVFLADVKGDLAGLCQPGSSSDDILQRLQRFGLDENGFDFHGYPVTFWDVYGKKGIQLRTTISEMGPLLLSRILGLNELQASILSVAFQIADQQQLLLVDTKDLKALLNYILSEKSSFEADYGRISAASVNVIIRAIAALEGEGGDIFFGDPALDIHDLFRTDEHGKGMIHILDSESLINHKELYSAFLLWLLSELFETLPEVGDLDKPKMVFFFDEAHLLFRDAPKSLLEKIEQVVRLIRSKGVGVWFCTQNPGDIPDTVLSQLGSKIEHGLHAYTPSDQKAVRSAADAFRSNPSFDTFDAIQALGTGEAVVSFLDEKGVPGVAEKITVLPPQSHMGAIPEEDREKMIKDSLMFTRYATAVDPDSAYEFLQRRLSQQAADEQKRIDEEARAKEEEKAKAAEQKAKEKAEAAAQKAKEREEAAREKAEVKEREAAQKKQEKEAQKQKDAYKRAARSVGSSVAGTVGREVGKSVGGSMFGKFGKTLGGNLGASLGRGLMSTLFRK